MAKKTSKNASDLIALPIQWIGNAAPSLFANQMIVQADETDFFLSFYEIVPPIAMGDEEEQKKQLQSMSAVQARCVARIVINADRMEKFAEAIQSTVTRHKEKQEALKNTNGKGK